MLNSEAEKPHPWGKPDLRKQVGLFCRRDNTAERLDTRFFGKITGEFEKNPVTRGCRHLSRNKAQRRRDAAGKRGEAPEFHPSHGDRDHPRRDFPPHLRPQDLHQRFRWEAGRFYRVFILQREKAATFDSMQKLSSSSDPETIGTQLARDVLQLGIPRMHRSGLAIRGASIHSKDNYSKGKQTKQTSNHRTRTIMKFRPSTTFAALAVASAAALSVNTASAGMDAKMPPPEMAPPVADPLFYGSVTVGYESTYIFRGVDFGDDAPYGSIDLGMNVAPGVTLDVGAWYINPTESTFDDELDLYAWLNFSVGPVSVGVGGTYYIFPEAGGGDTLEPGITLGYAIGEIAEISVGYYYDIEEEGSYIETSLSKSIDINDVISFNVGGGISYGIDYFGVSSFNHAFVTAGPSIALTENASLDLYVGGNFPLEDLEDAGEDDDVHGGASITVSF